MIIDEIEQYLERNQGHLIPFWLLKKMERAFCADFSDVRLHTCDLPKIIDAQAFAYGNNIFFQTEIFDKWTFHAQFILGHELTHVLQQRTRKNTRKEIVNDPSLENEADIFGLYSSSGIKIPFSWLSKAENLTYYPVVQAYDRVKIEIPNSNTMRLFESQVKESLSFLISRLPHQPRIAAHTGPHIELRVSKNRKMAIEATDLLNRQPKVFYAQQDFFERMNQELKNKGLRQITFDLNLQKSIAIDGYTLYEVRPIMAANNDQRIQLAEDCTTFTDNLSPAPQSPLIPKDYREASENSSTHVHASPEEKYAWYIFGDRAHPISDDFYEFRSHLAFDYGTSNIRYNPELLAQYSINEFVDPGICQAFNTISLDGFSIGEQSGQGARMVSYEFRGNGNNISVRPYDVKNYCLDYSSDESKKNNEFYVSRTWGNHIAIVIAIDDVNVMTIQNYHRGHEDTDNTLNDKDERYYFQMYKVLDYINDYYVIQDRDRLHHFNKERKKTWHFQWGKQQIRKVALATFIQNYRLRNVTIPVNNPILRNGVQLALGTDFYRSTQIRGRILASPFTILFAPKQSSQ